MRSAHDERFDESKKSSRISRWSALDPFLADNMADHLPLLSVSFDDISRGYADSRPLPLNPARPSASGSAFVGPVPHLALEGLLRVDQVDRLPQLPPARKVAIKDTVAALHDILDTTPVMDESYHHALVRLGVVCRGRCSRI